MGRLSGASAVILEDVPAHRVSRELLAALPFYVEEQGGGLWMVGGKFSFGSGGYFESPIDPLLPVSMELRQEHRKLAVALAVVLDRSGSMGGWKMVAARRAPSSSSFSKTNFLFSAFQIGRGVDLRKARRVLGEMLEPVFVARAIDDDDAVAGPCDIREL